MKPVAKMVLILSCMLALPAFAQTGLGPVSPSGASNHCLVPTPHNVLGCCRAAGSNAFGAAYDDCMNKVGASDLGCTNAAMGAESEAFNLCYMGWTSMVRAYGMELPFNVFLAQTPDSLPLLRFRAEKPADTVLRVFRGSFTAGTVSVNGIEVADFASPAFDEKGFIFVEAHLITGTNTITVDAAADGRALVQLH